MRNSEHVTNQPLGKNSIAGWIFIAWTLAVCFTFSNSFFDPFDEWKGLVFYLGCAVISAIVSFQRKLESRENTGSPIRALGDDNLQRVGRLLLVCIAFFILSFASLIVARGPVCEGLSVISKSVLMFAFIWAASRLPDSFIEHSFKAITVLISAMIIMLLLKIDLPPLIAIDGYIIRPVGHISYFSDLILACIFMMPFQIWRSKNILRIIWGISAIILGAGLWMTGTRASMIGLVGGAVVMGFCLIKYGILSVKRVLIWSLVSAVAFALIVAANPSADLRNVGTQDRVESLLKLNLRECSLILRRIAFFKTGGLVKERPLLGHGPGSFKFIYPEFAYKGEVHDESKAGQWYMHPHNELLFQLFETGAATTAVLVFIIAMLCLGLLRRLKTSDDRREKIYIACVLSGLLAMIASVQFSPSMQFTTTRLMFAMFAGILLRHAMPVPEKYVGARCTRAVFVSIICCAALFVTAYHAGLYAAYKSWRSVDRNDRLTWSKAADALAPGAFYPLYVRAAMSSMYESPAESERESRRLYRSYPFVSSVLYMRGIALMRAGRIDEAREAVRHALANDPNFEAAGELLKRLESTSKP